MRQAERHLWSFAVGRKTQIHLESNLYISLLNPKYRVNVFNVFSHLLQTGAIEDLLIVSERQTVKGISRIVAVTGREAKRVRETSSSLVSLAQTAKCDVGVVASRLGRRDRRCLRKWVLCRPD